MTYTALILPYKLVFVTKGYYIEIIEIYSWNLTEDIINYLFIVDILVCMLSTYYKSDGSIE